MFSITMLAAITLGSGMASAQLPVLSLSVDADNATEADTGAYSRVRITQTTADLSETVVARISVGGTATPNVDHTKGASFTRTFDPDVTSRIVSIYAKDDDLTEGTETIVVSLTPNAAYSIDPDHASVTLHVLDDEVEEETPVWPPEYLPLDADPDLDNRNNLVEYIEGTNPDVADTGSKPSIAVDGNRVSMQLVERKTLGPLHREISFATDLTSPFATLRSPSTNILHSGTDAHTLEVDLPANGKQCFYKLNYAVAPKRTILLTIDGMPSRLHERISMPNLDALISEGVLFKEIHLPLPDHPEESTDYPWTCSLPNPVLMSGTVFIGQDNIHSSLIQHVFTERPTAFYVNLRSYVAISDGFSHYEVVGTQFQDERSFAAGKAGILANDPAFMRIHCQGPGSAGHLSANEDNAEEPYYQNIWHPDSPFIAQNQYVDGLLGDFVQWLKDEELWDSTVLLVMGDHGEADGGGHPPYEPGGRMTQLIVAGADIKQGVTYDYAEMIDIAPTIAWLQDVDPPALSCGRILREMRIGNGAPTVSPLMQNLNQALLDHYALNPGPLDPPFYTIEQIGLWHTQTNNFKAFVEYQVNIIENL